MTADHTTQPLDLGKIRANLDAARIHLEEAHFDCCSGHRLGWFVPALLAEVERLRAEAKRQQQWKADVLREAAHEIESRYPADVWLPDSPSPDAQAAKGVRVACAQLRHMAGEIDFDALDTAGTAPAAGGEEGR